MKVFHKEEENREKDRHTFNPCPTVRVATYVGRPRRVEQANIAEKKPQSVPQRNSGGTAADTPLGELRLRRLFIWTSSPLLENKQLIWQPRQEDGLSVETPHPPLPSTTSAPSLAGYITFTNSFPFPSLL